LKDDVEYGKINVKYSEVTKMIFDLKNEKPEILPNFKGGEKYLIAKMHFDGVNRILHGTLVPGATIGEHTHDVNSEIIYFLSGRGYMLYDGEKQPVEAGMCHYCPKGHTHSMINDSDGDLVFFAVVANQ
jgi:mannose-6-phosphate isomerase-like protein (cupin superfamily)